MFPDLCIDEEEETEEEQVRIEILNEKLKKNLNTCSPQEVFKCK
jgi:triosephosphate isomerase